MNEYFGTWVDRPDNLTVAFEIRRTAEEALYDLLQQWLMWEGRVLTVGREGQLQTNKAGDVCYQLTAEPPFETAEEAAAFGAEVAQYWGATIADLSTRALGAQVFDVAGNTVSIEPQITTFVPRPHPDDEEA